MTGIFKTLVRRQCVGQDSNGSFELVKSEKVAETSSGVPLCA